MRNSLLGGLLALALAVLPVAGAEIKIDFSDYPDHLAPTNFTSVLAGTGQPGAWTILPVAVAPLLAPLSPQAPVNTRQLVLAQTNQDPTDERFPILVYDGDTFADFKLTTGFKLVSGLTEQMAGVVFRFQNASNFYVVRASALGHNVRFYKMVNGIRSDPIGPQLDVTAGVWHTLAVQCGGNQINIWLDGNSVMPPLRDVKVGAHAIKFAAGKIGLWTKSDAVSYFRDLTIDYTPRIPAAQAMVENILKTQSRLLGLRIYALDGQGRPHVIASKDAKEIGRAGGDAETAAITSGQVSLGREPGTVAVWLPYRDRNGDPMASVWVRLKSFFGETQDHAITRATQIVKFLQGQISNREDLLK